MAEPRQPDFLVFVGRMSWGFESLSCYQSLIIIHMEKFITKDQLGEFVSKFVKANEGKDIQITLELKEQRIQLYYRERMGRCFESVNIVDKAPTLESLIEKLSE